MNRELRKERIHIFSKINGELFPLLFKVTGFKFGSFKEQTDKTMYVCQERTFPERRKIKLPQFFVP
jgi:hypothetical protein